MRGTVEEPPTADGETRPRPEVRPHPQPGPGGGAAADAGAAAVEVVDPDGRLSAEGLAWLVARARAALRELGCGPGSLSVRVVGDAEMSAAHERYKGESGTTDVLTFDLSEGSGGLEADLLVCVDEAGRQARARGHREEHELLLYVIHGVLHCLGHDDGDEASAARMHAEEDRVLTAIGVGPTFAREASS